MHWTADLRMIVCSVASRGFGCIYGPTYLLEGMLAFCNLNILTTAGTGVSGYSGNVH